MLKRQKFNKMIDRILIDETYGKYEIIDDNGDGIDYGNAFVNLKRVNIFVGANNSGKSRLLRTLMGNSELMYSFKEIPINEIGINFAVLNFLYAKSRKINNRTVRNNTLEKVFSDLNRHKWFVSNLNNSVVKEIWNFVGINDAIRMTANEVLLYLEFPDQNRLNGTILEIERLSKNLERSNFTSFYDLNRVYFPMMRGLRPLFLNPTSDDQDLNFKNYEKKNEIQDTYKSRTLKDYPVISESGKSKVYTGLEMYHQIKDHLLNHRNKRDVIADFERFLGEHFFNGQSVSLIPHINSDVLNIGIGSEQERPIYDLGDGIQALIILLFPLFTISKDQNTLVFIEEPELSLHPGMQRIFMETLLDERFSHLQFFITTHSNHLLDLSLESDAISIYTFKKKPTKEPEFVVENVYHGNTEILDLLGVKSSSVFLSNSTIWVEGITDRKYLKFYLKVYFHVENIHNLREDVEYTFMEYGGSNITHFDFGKGGSDEITVSRISNKFLAIADSDNVIEGSKKKQRQDKLKELLGDNFILLSVTEIENLLSRSIVHQICRNDEHLNIPNDNHEQVKMGHFIFEKYPNSPFGKENSTVNHKLNFCNKAIKVMETELDKCKGVRLTKETVFENGIMSEKAWDLTKGVVEFIQESNNI